MAGPWIGRSGGIGGLVAAAVLAGCAIAAPGPGGGIAVLSSRPDMVTGGDALIEVPAGARVVVNGVDQSADFVPDPVSGRLRGRIEGLSIGPSRLSLWGPSGLSEIELVNHPQSGPVFSGPHQSPFVCETQAFRLPDGRTLGPTQDPNCWAPTNVQYLYKPTGDAQLKPLDPAAPRPADLARTRTSAGQEVDYVVRLETGVINRAIYQIAMLADPHAPAPTPTARSPGWNGVLVYSFGGGCGAAYRQGRGVGGVINGGEMGNDPLERGYAVASASLNVLGQNCNDVTSAETVMMVKEHFIESFGPPRYTIGLGGSGGSMQQSLLVQNYPGLLDGILPERSYPDTATVLVSAADCPLMSNYFDKNGQGWTDAQKSAVVGFPRLEHCSTAFANYLPRWVSPLGSGCDSTAFITAQEGGGVAGTRGAAFTGALYDPVKSPNGTRCGYYDNAVNIYGRNPDGSSRSALDNVGVQYGLKAFNDGVIDFEQFLDLNSRIGGYNSDAGFVPARTRGDPEAIRISYATGRVNSYAGLDRVPIIDVRSYLDHVMPADVHLAYTTEVARRRLIRAAGDADNFVVLTTATLGSLRQDIQAGDSPLRQVMRMSLAAMDQWLDAIDRDASGAPQAEKVVRNKPASLIDACFTETMQKIAMTRGPGDACTRRFPDFSDPRIVAGDSIERMTMKCALAPVSARFYSRPLTEAQLQRLRQAFPEGVCDYGQPSQHQAGLAGTWIAFPTPGTYRVGGR